MFDKISHQCSNQTLFLGIQCESTASQLVGKAYFYCCSTLWFRCTVVLNLAECNFNFQPARVCFNIMKHNGSPTEGSTYLLQIPALSTMLKHGRAFGAKTVKCKKKKKVINNLFSRSVQNGVYFKLICVIFCRFVRMLRCLKGDLFSSGVFLLQETV